MFFYNRFKLTQHQKSIIENQQIITEKQKKEIETKNNLILQSIDYAKRIQDAFIQSEIVLQESNKEYFLLNQPKDIVSGDFLWAKRKDPNLLFAVADCTGHGVPGAFMSLVGYNLLEQASDVYKLNSPRDILDNVNLQLQKALKPKEGGSSYEGMDVLICNLNLKTNLLQFAGTKHRLYHYTDKTIQEYRTDSISIGFETTKKFTQFEIQLRKNDMLYLFTDGFPDQKGGPDKTKLYYEAFKNLLMAHLTEDVQSQKTKLIDDFQKWKGNEDQVDDILVFGLKI